MFYWRQMDSHKQNFNRSKQWKHAATGARLQPPPFSQMSDSNHSHLHKCQTPTTPIFTNVRLQPPPSSQVSHFNHPYFQSCEDSNHPLLSGAVPWQMQLIKKQQPKQAELNYNQAEQ